MEESKPLKPKDVFVFIFGVIGTLYLGFTLFSGDGPDPDKDCHNTRLNKIGAFVYSHKFMEKRLRSPSTADFPRYSASGVIVKYLRPCHFLVAGYVDAENAFGGTVRTRYVINMEVDPKDGGWWGRDLVIE